MRLRRGCLQPAGHPLVGPDHRRCPVPYGALGLAGKDACQRAVRRVPLRNARLLVDSGAHQRVTEPVLRILDLHQPSGHGGDQHIDCQCRARQQGRRPHHLIEPWFVVQGGHQQCGARRDGKIRHSRRKGPFQSCRERQPGGQPRPGAELLEGNRQLHQRKRIARRLAEQSLPCRDRENGSAAVKQRRCCRRGQRLEVQGWKPCIVERTYEAVPDRDEKQDRLELQPPRDERQHVAGGAVEPVSILRDNQHRGTRRALGQQVQRGERRQEKVGSDIIGQSERRQHRAALRRGQPAHQAENWLQKLVQACERQLRLALHARDHQHQHPAILRAPAGLPQQR